MEMILYDLKKFLRNSPTKLCRQESYVEVPLTEIDHCQSHEFFNGKISE